MERGPAYAVEGVEAGLPVATARGWRAAGALRAGEAIVTLGGLAVLRGVARSCLGAGMKRAFWPLALPAGALGNAVGMILPADQRIALGMDGGVMLLPARALEHWRGAGRVAPDGRAVVRLWFDRPQVVVAAGLHFACGGTGPDSAEAGAGAGPLSPGVPEAREIMALRIAFDAGRGLAQAALAKRR